MIKQLATMATPVLQSTYVRRTRRNHGLEHATIHVLSKRVKNLKIAGRSDAQGFVLMGDVDTDQVEKAVADALKRMKNGEHNLAIHPNCGTNLVTTGMMTTAVAVLGLGGSNTKLTGNRISWTLTMMIGALIVSQPLGMSLQRHFTTDGDPGDMEISGISRRNMAFPWGGSMVVHRVDTVSG